MVPELELELDLVVLVLVLVLLLVLCLVLVLVELLPQPVWPLAPCQRLPLSAVSH
ncbi:hypothetical protein [Pseudidiomarina sp.]|uniref:hypothetical protein n=1 Tax=Pseudidiomarina sp. TaxID=2081707 RepID=UPI00299E4331|nr:hypothetical protein [Pseudidiomarina sp.]MDX1706510.1 hypothetical protein [Pseudidiomarina sp.]